MGMRRPTGLLFLLCAYEDELPALVNLQHESWWPPPPASFGANRRVRLRLSEQFYIYHSDRQAPGCRPAGTLHETQPLSTLAGSCLFRTIVLTQLRASRTVASGGRLQHASCSACARKEACASSVSGPPAHGSTAKAPNCQH